MECRGTRELRFCWLFFAAYGIKRAALVVNAAGQLIHTHINTVFRVPSGWKSGYVEA